jgi:two-component system catabolic regulation response regulator CreB
MKDSILVVEDERTIAETVVYALEREGFEAHWCSTGNEGLEFVRSGKPSLAILDIGLPDLNGLDLCREIRGFSMLPIIFLSARQEELDRILGLELGGDDYVTKPFSPRELVARVRSVLRRHTISQPPQERDLGPAPGEVLEVGDFTELKDQMRIAFKGQNLDLSTHEYRLLSLLLSRPNRVYSREQILQFAWEQPEMVTDRTVDAHIKAVRKKIKRVDENVNPIRTVRGVGYAFEPES